MQKRSQKIMLAITCMLALIFIEIIWSSEGQAVPAFARKYNVNCNVCHTRPPRLNPYGERFLENGYQLPGTEDGGIIGKNSWAILR